MFAFLVVFEGDMCNSQLYLGRLGMRAETATILNLTCKFGEKDLLDYANEIILPAFNSGLERKYGNTRYLLLDVKVGKVGVGDATEKAVFGRFVKDTILRREQVLTKEKTLIESANAMQSSPSAFFVLLLKDHRLIYFAETAYAPDYKAFASTLQWLFRKQRKKHVDEVFTKLSQNTEKKNFSKLRKQIESELIPRPDVTLLPIPTDESMRKFIERYSKLKMITFKINRSNAEFNPSQAWRAVEENFPSGLEGSTTIETRNPEGLDTEQAKKLVSEGAKAGVHEIKTNGVDYNGENLKGKNEDMRIDKKLESIPPTKKGLANKLVSLFTGNQFRKSAIETTVQEKLNGIPIDD